jgi:type I restriction enzyme, S subunit
LLASALRRLVTESRRQAPRQSLADVARWGSGGTPRAGDSRYYREGTIPWAVIGDLTDGPVSETAARITPLAIQESSAKLVPPNSVLVAMYGSIGKLGLPEIPMATNQAIAFAEPRGELDRKFLFWYLRSQRHHLMAAGKGGTQKNISQTVLKSWHIQVPSIDVQQHLVSYVENVDAEAARIRVSAAEALRHEQSLRRALLAAAFSGRLTGQASDLHHAEELAGVGA